MLWCTGRWVCDILPGYCDETGKASPYSVKELSGHLHRELSLPVAPLTHLKQKTLFVAI